MGRKLNFKKNFKIDELSAKDKINMTKTLLTTYTKTQISKALNFDRRSYYTSFKLDTKDKGIVIGIQDIYINEDDSIGAKKLAKILGIGKNRCQRIMSKYGIEARKKRDGYEYAGRSSEIYENLLLTGKVTDYSDIYFSDMFEFKLVDGTEVHGCFIFKHSTRQVISILLDYFEGAELVEKTLEESKEHIKPNSIFHVDQGRQNRATITIQKVKDLSMAISMSRSGTPTDNPFAERFVRTFKLAIVHKRPYLTLGNALEVTLKWINFYNERRPHEALKQLSPNNYAMSIGEKTVSIKTVFRV